ncbi:hydroxyacylglutathione hydrolase C-terminal domain-containing protein [Sphingosinicella soli]|uniref:hydroxyacylglutathione hydrolase n=1 Tax=Sphingosinicella soli TaxID=333708 RepID=A0A7W7F6X9_9SPHN|nr:hydroxyacylglutathione hydrolase C-terminal domain-containing protein [Sphingosinicella soli]MBB4633035.1 hydroxyacylglutathione hydrolase [Sphingosinicella soli]
MRVVPIALRNAFDHVNYLLVCDTAKEAVAVDPYDVERVTAEAAAQGVKITGVVNTHEHWDHAGKNAEMKARTGAAIMAPRAAAGTLEGLDRMLVDGDTIPVGTAEITVRAVPGHTMASIALFGEEDGAAFVISGDTLFGAGVGNCGYGGDAPTLQETISGVFAPLADETRVYPGHDYLKRNLTFTLAVEPGNAAARALASALESRDDAAPRFTTIGEERAINPFLRPGSAEIRANLPELADPPSDADVFLALRKRRDSW